MGRIMLNGRSYGGDDFTKYTRKQYNALTPYEKTHGKYVITDEETGDLAENFVTFTSGDSEDVDATSWTSVAPMANTDIFSTLFNKISTMAKNVRYLYKMLGTTDISAIGNGTVTGGISTLNSDLNDIKSLTNLGGISTTEASLSESVANFREIVMVGSVGGTYRSTIVVPSSIISANRKFQFMYHWDNPTSALMMFTSLTKAIVTIPGDAGTFVVNIYGKEHI